MLIKNRGNNLKSKENFTIKNCANNKQDIRNVAKGC